MPVGTDRLTSYKSLAREDEDFRDVVTIKFADTLDELIDGGPCYSVDKPMVFGLRNDAVGYESLLSAVKNVVDDGAADQFRAA